MASRVRSCTQQKFLWPIRRNIATDSQNVRPKHLNVRHMTIYLQWLFILSFKQSFTLSESIFYRLHLGRLNLCNTIIIIKRSNRGDSREKQKERQKVLRLWVRTQNNLSICTSAAQQSSDRLSSLFHPLAFSLPYLALVVQIAYFFSADMERIAIVEELVASGCGGLLHQQTDSCLSGIASLGGGWSSFASQQQQRFKAVTFCLLSEPQSCNFTVLLLLLFLVASWTAAEIILNLAVLCYHAMTALGYFIEFLTPLVSNHRMKKKLLDDEQVPPFVKWSDAIMLIFLKCHIKKNLYMFIYGLCWELHLNLCFCIRPPHHHSALPLCFARHLEV